VEEAVLAVFGAESSDAQRWRCCSRKTRTHQLHAGGW